MLTGTEYNFLPILFAAVINESTPSHYIQVFPVNTATALASPVNFTCSTVEDPLDPSYQWYKDGTAIPGETEAYLHIEGAAPEHRGNYTCTAVISDEGRVEESQPARLTIPGTSINSYLDHGVESMHG